MRLNLIFQKDDLDYMIQKIMLLFKNDVVLTISMILAVLSCFVIPPDLEYISYIDFNTLIVLFSLMLIIEGLKELKFFDYIGNIVLSRVKNERGIIFTLVFLCFFAVCLLQMMLHLLHLYRLEFL